MKIGLNHHRFGVNYTPTRSWWYCWNDFDIAEIARDLDSIQALAADHIRIMLMWPYFQPNPQRVSRAHLDRLRVLMDLARERNLDVCVSLFVGWLSGYAFKPPFQRDDSFYDPAISGKAQDLYLTEVAAVVRDCDNFLGFDLGNELNCCWQTEDLAQGDAWHTHQLERARTLCPRGVHVNGVDHNPWFRPATFSPQNLARTQSIIALHCWSYFTGALERCGGDCLARQPVQLLAAMAALARAYAGDPQKPVWAQEYGMSDEWLAPARIPEFLEASTLHGIRAGVSWFTWWASHDLDTAFAFKPLEYSLGLITHDRKLKPQGEVFKALAESYRGRPATVPPTPHSADAPPMHEPDAIWRWLEEQMTP